MKINESIFRAYDIRGKYPEELNPDIAYRIGLAYAKKIQPKIVVLGRDLRKSNAEMYDKVLRALAESGVDVKDAGEMTNPMIGFAIFNYGFDGGIILSASHNPIGYGGMKMMKKNAVSIPGDDSELKKYTLESLRPSEIKKGNVEKIDISSDYIKFVRSQIDTKNLKNKRILLDASYGSVSLIIDKVLEGLPIEKINFRTKPDKNFGGLPEPNPQNLEVQKETIELTKKDKPDFAVMWDGDGDRVFFLDENAEFVPAPYITAVLSEAILKKNPNAKIVGDPRIIWPIKKAIKAVGGDFIISKSGYRFIKEKMMEIGAEFGAEMTAHYYFSKTHYMDNGIIPFLMIWELLSISGKKLSELVSPYRKGHYLLDEVKLNGEIDKIIPILQNNYQDCNFDYLDGVTVESKEFRFNIRGSNTEPVIKLNMEATSEEILQSEKEKILNLVK